MEWLIKTPINRAIENPEYAEKIKDENKIFKEEQDSASPKKTEELKDSAWKLFWKNFNPDLKILIENKEQEEDPENILKGLDNTDLNLDFDKLTDIEEETKNIEDSNENNSDLNEKVLDNNKYYPVIKRLFDWNQLSQESFNNIKENIINNNWNLDTQTLNIDIDEKKNIEWLIVNLEWDNKKQNLIDFSSDIKSLDEFSSFNINIDKNWSFESEVLNMIWKNYIKIPDFENNIDSKFDISTAIKITSKDIINDVKNIPDCQTLDTALKNIWSWDLNEQLEWINSLYVLAFSSEWKLAKKEVNSYKEKRKKEIIKEANILDKNLKIAEESSNKNEIDKLESQKEELIKEAKELTSWEVFESWDFDKVSDKDPLSNLENK